MQDRSQRGLRRVGIGLLSIVVVLLMLLEDLLYFAGLLLRKILPANFEEFLKSRSTQFMYGVVGVAIAIYIGLHVVEYLVFWWGFWWTGAGLSILSKFYFVAVPGYLCRVYADRLLAVGWISRVWEWYLASKDWLKSFELYQFVHAHYERIKERLKVGIQRFRERAKGRSMFATAWRIIRSNRRRS